MVAKKQKVSVPCATCGSALERHPYRLTYAKHQFCNVKCYGVWRALNSRGNNHPRWVAELTVKCDHCGQEIRKNSRNKLERNKHNFCSAECSHAWMSANEVFTGKNNHNWKGGEVDYYGPNWFRQQRAARKRDGYKCRHCGKSQKNHWRSLDVHHIIPFRTFGYIRNQNDLYKQANALNNLITLCPQCHAKAEAQLIPIQPSLL